MAAVTQGTGATVKGQHAEVQLLNAFALMQNLETKPDINIGDKDNVNGSFDISELTFAGDFTFNCSQQILPNGRIVYLVQNYLDYPQFTAGNPEGTFKSPDLPSYFLEVFIYCQKLEALAVHNPDKVENLSGSFNTDDGVFSGSIALPCTMLLDPAGGVLFRAKPYLLD